VKKPVQKPNGEHINCEYINQIRNERECIGRKLIRKQTEPHRWSFSFWHKFSYNWFCMIVFALISSYTIFVKHVIRHIIILHMVYEIDCLHKTSMSFYIKNFYPCRVRDRHCIMMSRLVGYSDRKNNVINVT